jgi:hypothetical protein
MKKIFFGIILLVFLSCNKDIKDPTAQINAFGFTNIQEARENYGNRKKIRRLKYQEDIDCPILLFFS